MDFSCQLGLAAFYEFEPWLWMVYEVMSLIESIPMFLFTHHPHSSAKVIKHNKEYQLISFNVFLFY